MALSQHPNPLLSAYGRLGAARKWGRTLDRTTATESMRRGFEARFVRLAQEAAASAGVDASDAQIARMAASFRQEHYAYMAVCRLRRAKGGR